MSVAQRNEIYQALDAEAILVSWISDLFGIFKGHVDNKKN